MIWFGWNLNGFFIFVLIEVVIWVKEVFEF